MAARIHLPGSSSFRLKALSNFSFAVAHAAARRTVKGPRLPGWNWFVEIATEALRKQLTTAFEMPTLDGARRFLDSIEFPTGPSMPRTHIALDGFEGDWFEAPHPVATVLYFHGGGYTFYPRSYRYLIELITRAAQSRLFALDYPLAPEHTFPAQLDAAIAAYTWLLDEGIPPGNLLVAGDSAGAHLALGCLLRLKELKLPKPALAIAISPPTDLEPDWPSLTGNAKFDWIQNFMLQKWTSYFCSAKDRANPLVSLNKAEFTKLCPIYIQCGGAEILHDSIHAFAQFARTQGARITIETWPDMNHVFQIFGSFSPQSSEALSRIGKVVAETFQQDTLRLS
jgi:monoterpene epsilon-lactone hydrolase